MKKIIFLTAIFFLLFLSPSLAQVDVNLPASGYQIEDFQSEIFVNRNTTLAVAETIKVNFLTPKHGIFRIIPIIYSAKGKTIRAKLKVLSVTDENGNPYQYETERSGQSIKIKIGDPNQTITGKQTYVIQYTTNRVLLRYPEHDEVYWNVTGSEWDTTIENATAIV